MDAPTFIWMFLVLKIPIAAALWLIWWAVREPEPDSVPDDHADGGPKRHQPPSPWGPRSPRRGPHTGVAPPAPRRMRTRAVGRSAMRPPAERHTVR